jgi:hypothetical protein
MKKSVAGIALAALVVFAAACQPSDETAPAANANVNANANTGALANANTANTNAPPPTVPGSPEDIIARQPDFTADIRATSNKVVIDAHVFRKGGNARAEFTVPPQYPLPLPPNSKVVILSRPGEPSLIYAPEQKMYMEAPVTSTGNPATAIGEFLNNLKSDQRFKLEDTGSETIDGHDTRKLRITHEGKDTEVFVYAAKDLQNLIVKLDGRVEGQPLTVTLSNISLTVPDTAFEPPANYQTEYKKLDPAAMMGGAAPPANTNAAPSPPSANRP